jgi:ABC-type Mn2+/Zn2+ transport system ATPase subunit
METLLELCDLVIGYDRRPLLNPISLAVRRGEFWGIVGPNGSGKTTLVKTLLGILKPVGGHVRFPAGRPPAFGYVPQADTIDKVYPITGREIVTLGRMGRFGPMRAVSARDREVIERSLKQTEALAYAGRPFRDLSGGQKQRTLLARALATEPDILVLDEPISGMDLAGESAIMGLIQGLGRGSDLTILMISHALSVVANHVEQILLLDRENRNVLEGPVAEVLVPARLRALYGLDIAIEEVRGQKTIFVEREKAGAAPLRGGRHDR